MMSITLSGTGTPRKHRGMPVIVRISLAWIALMLIVAVLALWLAPYDPNAINLPRRLSPPTGFGGDLLHPLGTDELGRDVFSRLVFSIQTSVLIAVAATITGAVLGTTLGFLSAHFRGIAEQAIQALVDFQATMPFLILALAALAFLGNSPVILAVLLSLHGWERYARIARSLAISANAQGYAEAVRQLGVAPLLIYWRHILPNVASTLIVSMTIALPEIIILESGLSFLGLGIQPPASSLGTMVGYGRDYLTTAPWTLVAPATIISLTAFSACLLGDWLRDHLDRAAKH